MARRKRQFLDDDDSDSDSSGRADHDVDMDDNPDARAERDLFENPYQRKRRRVNGKEDAIYGVFGESDDDEDDAKTRRRRADLTKAPVFTSSKKMDTSLDAEMDNEPDKDDEDNEGGGDTDAVEDDSSADEQPAPPRVRDEDEDDAPRPRFGAGIGSMSSFARGGIGSKAPDTEETPVIGGIGSASRPTEDDEAPSRPGLGGIGSARGGIGSGRGGIDSGRGGIGARSTPADSTPSFPTAFGKTPSTQKRKSFLRGEDNSREGTPAANLSATEKLHFSKLEGTFGARLMAKMGWQAGTGLGSSGEGIVTPIETKLRPNRVGIAFKGFKERTEQSKAEARRRGEDVSDDDKPKKKSGGKKAAEPVDRSAAWKSKPRKAKKRDVEHKTYEQILADAADAAPLPQEKIIDATGAGGPRELTSLAEMASWTPSTDAMRIPEVRHNLRLIVDMCKGELDGLAREARALEERKKWVNAEDARLRKKMADEAQLIARLQNIHLIVDDISSKSQQASSDYEPSFDTFTPGFSRLVEEYPKEYTSYHLDHIVVASVAPAVRRDLASWHPLEEPSKLTAVFAQWQPALKMTIPEAPKTDVGMYSGISVIPSKPIETDLPMTAYDSLLWNAWLPKVRSSLNNDWSADNAAPAIRLYEAWATLLPPFIRDNLLDQVVLPKVQKAVADWSPRAGTSLRGIVFPWLPHVGLRVDELLGDAKRKVKSIFRSWSPKDGVPAELMAWKDVFPPAEWENLILKYIVPKLGSTLRDDLRINPRDQVLDPLKWVLAWDGTLRTSTFAALLDQEFFPKWLGVLHTWLVHPSANLAEIAEWYGWWRGQLPQTDSVKAGLARGLKMMDDAMALGADRSRLPKPERAVSNSAPAAKGAPAKPRPSARATEITFRALVEEHAATHNLLVLPTQRVHEASRMPLLRVSKTVEGRAGLLVYVLDDAVWTAPEAGGDGPWRAITMDEMVVLANRKS
ncbi:TFP11-domain-containing protein [Auricularia subglabra TFB-10046 SS5]|nr:TFP11-domain-containing protein [Auricularia subglabra TFB-10046 SS5]